MPSFIEGRKGNLALLKVGKNNSQVEIRNDGSIKPVQLADSEAVNDSIYYSTTQSKLVYKDSGGTVNDLY